ncbi:Methionine aminopeptidase [uncultured spirochete]|jgi:methionyl aminopeptidase|uniref:Methionine aminopeptidase n=1 Tax=uncultured spirochete TaxID=156406 RepID=A0A3P3XF23_9SPIR|nr:type I methionyl aminopeptidase [Rectinema subterraneum]SLM09815.1 Methionine aminopeptidase [uncultured spirochete]
MIRIKNKKQIEGIRASCQMLSALYDALKPLVQPGATPKDLDRFAYDFIVKNGGKPAFLGYEGYPATLCISVNDVVIHGIPGSRPLEEGDIVGIDSGIDLDGFFSDAAFTLPVGKITTEAQKLLDVTKECLDLAIAQIKPHSRISDISRAVFSHATKNGFKVVRQYCGHGVGLEIHEDPQIPNYVSAGPNPRIMPGMVLAVEPMINVGTSDVRVLDDDWTVVTMDGSLSAHFEHTVLVTDSGCEVLTRW